MQKMKKKISLHAGVKTKPWELQQRLNFAALVETCPEGLLGHLHKCNLVIHRQISSSCNGQIGLLRLRLSCLKWTQYKEFFRQRFFFSHQGKLRGFFSVLKKRFEFFRAELCGNGCEVAQLGSIVLQCFGHQLWVLMPCVPILCTAALGASRESGH